MKNLLKIVKGKAGMTLVELLVALSLLMLIIMSFTPMLLNSYSHLYAAGERTEELYDAKTELEKGLSERLSSNIATFNVNFKDLINNIDLKGRRITSTMKENFETVFHGARARIDILSGNTIYDDKTEHEIIIQCTNLAFANVLATNQKGDAKWAATPANNNPANQTMVIVAYLPNKNAGTNKSTDDELVYTTDKLVPITLVEANSSSGKIKVKVSGFDFTNSPIKFKVFYYDEKCSQRDVSTYLYVKPATILLGGTTSNYDYYTSPGVDKKVNNTTGTETETLELYGRTMTSKNSAIVSSSGTPKGLGAEILNVSWIDNDPTTGLDPYYVITGTKGTMYRMYNFTTTSGTLYNTVVPSTASGSYVPDKIYKLPDGTVIYSNLWSGDYSHQFGYSTWQRSMGYRWDNTQHSGSSCWYTQDGVNGVTSSAYNKFGIQTKYAYVYNGYRTDYTYSQQNGRKISYCLAETVASLRFVGCQKSDFNGYNSTWERNNTWLGGSWIQSNTETTKSCYIRIKCDDSVLSDKHFGYINMKSFNSLAPSYLFETSKYENASASNWRSKIIKYIDTAPQATTSLSVTDAVYDEGMGGMYYVGSANGYALIRQNDLTSTGEAERVTMVNQAFGNRTNIPEGVVTAYYINGSASNKGTTIKKISRNDGSIDSLLTTLSQNSEATTNIQDRKTFFITRSTGLSQALFSDTEFSFGFASNHEKTFTEVTVQEGEEEYKSYEKYYFRSHYGDANHEPAWFAYNNSYASSVGYNANVKNTANDDYYNIWFPGEFYNIRKVVSKDGVTVGVGYAVSGSTYQWINPNKTANSSTAIGDIFNDGILAVKTVKENYFANKLYFKDNSTFDGSSLKSTEYTTVYGSGGYGTHSRRSIQFTAVDLLTEESGSSRNYYAYYGDNTGRVFRSLVATANVTGSEDSSSITPVEYIRDLTFAGTASANSSAMEEIKIGDTSLRTYFSKIVSISANEDLVVISGTPVSGSAGYVVVGTKNESNVWTWKRVKIAADSSYVINDGLINDGYYYACGQKGTQGFLIACDIEKIKAASNNADLTSQMPAPALANNVKFNSLDGHST